MDKPRILDLFSGSGGAAKGYEMAGFAPYGVDLDPKPLKHYLYPSLCMDALFALEMLLRGDALVFGQEELRLSDFAAVHASPPCQGYSIMQNLPWLRHKTYPLLILPTIELLEKTGKPYVLENVMGARNGAKGLKKRGLEAHGLKAGYLCGTMFGMGMYRHRLFAANWLWLAPEHPKHDFVIRRGRDFGNSGDMANRREAACWPWMTQREQRQAIPPAYTEHIGQQLMLSMASRNEGQKEKRMAQLQWCRWCGRKHRTEVKPCPRCHCGTPQPVSAKVAEQCYTDYECEICHESRGYERVE